MFTKSFKIFWKSIEFLAQSFRNQSASYRILSLVGNQLSINNIRAKSSRNQFEIHVEIDWTPCQILYNSFGNRLNSLPNSREINSKSIKFLTKSFGNRLNSLPNLLEIIQRHTKPLGNQLNSSSNPRKFLPDSVEFLTKSFRNQFKFLPNLKEIDKIPGQILRKPIGNVFVSWPHPLKSFGNRLNSLPNPLEINQRCTKPLGNQLEIYWIPDHILYNSFGNRLNSLPNPLKINSNFYHILRKLIQFLAKSLGNQLEINMFYQILWSLLEIDWSGCCGVLSCGLAPLGLLFAVRVGVVCVWVCYSCGLVWCGLSPGWFWFSSTCVNSITERSGTLALLDHGTFRNIGFLL